ncbi:hypothetical protein A5881_002972 [Enterococcus termitis]|nr:hypothetical protein A5881_002371 [Enterococcus termitis]
MKNRKQSLLPLNLQFFADPATEPTDPIETTTEAIDPVEPTDPKEPDEPKKDGKKERLFNRQEMAKIVSEESKRAVQAALDEAERLKGMNDSQKLQYELDKATKELEEERKKNSFNKMSKEASKMLSEASISADDEILNFVVKDTAEDTQQAVNSFIGLIDKKAEEKTKAALSGTAPRVNLTPGKQMTKDEIMKITDPTKRQQAIKENIHLFRK